jgi:hypothetical protein
MHGRRSGRLLLPVLRGFPVPLPRFPANSQLLVRGRPLRAQKPAPARLALLRRRLQGWLGAGLQLKADAAAATHAAARQ